MLKTMNDILDAAHLKDGNRAALRNRIINRYNVKPATDRYKLEFSEKDFNRIVRLEIKRKKTYPPGNYARKERGIYYQNKDKGCYSRLTYYGGV